MHIARTGFGLALTSFLDVAADGSIPGPDDPQATPGDADVPSRGEDVVQMTLAQ